MKPILVTGGGKGLGAEISKCLAKKKHDLVIHYKQSEREAKNLADNLSSEYGGGYEVIYGDFSSHKSTQRLIENYLDKFPHTKGLVNNVGNYLIASLSETDASQWNGLFQTNFFAPIFLTRSLLPSLCKAKGCVVNIGLTGLKEGRGFTRAPAYAIAKSSLLFYTFSLAKELACENVRVNMISPGYMENAVDSIDFGHLPFKRAATLHEVAQITASLFDPEFGYVTGQNIEVAGGIGL